MVASSVVLVTGGSGFLGQHVVKHLQLFARNLKEIRVLDIVPYDKKLEYKDNVPIKSFVGSIVDRELVSSVCKGVDCVFHIASIVDSTMFPNGKAMYEINVRGTEVIVEACKANSVPNLIYCSSISVFYGFDEVEAGTENTLPVPPKLMFDKYAETKTKAQQIALNANGDILKNGNELRTCAILPLPMYGELDQTFVYQYVQNTKGLFTARIPRLGKMKARVQLSYVGNVAMMFVKAYECMRKGNKIGGEYFYAADDTPVDTIPALLRPYMAGDFTTKFYIPLWLLAFLLFLLYCILAIVRPFKKVNTQINITGMRFMNHTFFVTYDKARKLLGYKPLYDLQSAIASSNAYYARCWSSHH